MIIDLRDYTTTPGCRDRLIQRCESQLFDEQVRLGASFPGMFRDAEDRDRFVWLRGMPDRETRKRVLTDFYTDGEPAACGEPPGQGRPEARSRLAPNRSARNSGLDQPEASDPSGREERERTPP